MSARFWRLYRLSRKIWVRICLMALLAVLAAVAVPLAEGFIPKGLSDRFGADSVMPVLNILASSMLVVVTFSLSVMVAAHQQASSQITPRARRLLLEDTTTQTVLATFLGAFIFALVAIILFRAGFYTGRASVIVFAVTALVVVLVVVAILRWIEHLSHLGSMDDTLSGLEMRADRTLRLHRQAPFLLGQPCTGKPPGGLVPVAAHRSGYVQFVDMPALDACAAAHDVDVYLTCLPGDWVAEGDAIALVEGAGTGMAEEIVAAIKINALRSFDQDVRYGLAVMAEIGSRALSSGINDPGTAIDVIGRIERLLTMNAPSQVPAEPAMHARIHVPGVPEDNLIRAAFAMIARDGAAMVEVAGRLQITLQQLARLRDPDLSRAAKAMAVQAMAYCDALMVLDEDKERVRQLIG